ncbi:MAG: hypothetical protein WAZ94_00090 [Phycisphaerales bacterium]
MPPWLSNLLQNRAFWAAVLFIGIPVARAIIREVGKARARKVMIDQARAAELEELRTGPRPASSETTPVSVRSEPMSARQQLEAMAAQRRAELDRMRAQRGASSPSPSPMPARAPRAASPPPEPAPVRTPPTSGAAAQIRAAQRSAERTPPQPSPPPRKASRKHRTQQPMAQTAPVVPAARIDEEADASLTRRGLLERLAAESEQTAAAEAQKRKDTPKSRAMAIFGPDESISPPVLRRAIVLREVLGPPVSMRESA